MTTPETTRWLSSEEMEAWLPLIRIVTLLPQVLDRQLRTDVGITHVQYHILTRLSAAVDGQLRMSELADGVAISLSRLSHAVSTLERHGWVTRAAAKDDGRGQTAMITEEGRQLLQLAAPGHVAKVRSAVFDNLTEADITQLADVANRIAENLEP
jgi:DNA-binding MarR family transcriptional regulator